MLGLAVPAFTATVELEPYASGIEVVPGPDDGAKWSSVRSFADAVDRFGYQNGVQLLAATVRTFVDVADALGHRPPDGLRLRYHSTIPRQVGLAGSSALVISTLRCLGEHVGLEIADPVLASIALRVETEQLGITAGLQDRVVQSLGGLVAMDFATMETDARFGVRHGRYEQLDEGLLPPLFLAYREAAAEPSAVYHLDLRNRFDRGEVLVRETMRSLAQLVTEGRAALRWKDHDGFASLVGRNMELRRALGPLPASQLQLVEIAESVGLSATFAGSGGAVVGVYDPDSIDKLQGAYAQSGVKFLPLGSNGGLR